MGSEIVKATSLCICLSPPTFSRMSRGPEHRAAVLHGGSLGIAAARSPGLADLVRGASVIRSLISEHFGCPPGRTRQVSVSRGTEQHGVGLSPAANEICGCQDEHVECFNSVVFLSNLQVGELLPRSRLTWPLRCLSGRGERCGGSPSVACHLALGSNSASPGRPPSSPLGPRITAQCLGRTLGPVRWYLFRFVFLFCVGAAQLSLRISFPPCNTPP